MSFMDQLAAQRKKFLDGLDANQGDINLDIFEDFYPDQAHFIFELLQNAEDAEATAATFVLTQEGCMFQHNGRRAFTEPDVRAITGIHNSTKTKDPDQIGRFGVGFKSVFVYTLTPVIHSKDFSFRISRFVLPETIDSDPQIGAMTRFEFPFDNPKKAAQEAYEEVQDGLTELAATTLLFLAHLESIRWQIGEQEPAEVLRIPHPENHIEVQKRISGKTVASSHFLRFLESVRGLEKRHVSVAFALDHLPNVSKFDPGDPLAKQLKIIPANPGRVAVFFPADKETSGLRFHLHAPFVPELSRASIKGTPANDPLFTQLAELAAASLHTIRDLNLLTSDFLAVLPNPQDAIPARYQPIRKAIVEEMNNQPLTPTHSKSHAPAKYLLQAKASLKDLLSEADIKCKCLVDYSEQPPQWAVAASSNTDRFLSGLAIREWDVNKFIDVLVEKASIPRRIPAGPGLVYSFPNADTEFIDWLAEHSFEWHQQMYALLGREVHGGPENRWNRDLDRLKNVQFVRLSDGKYSVGRGCYFPSDVESGQELILRRVDKGVYSSGKSKPHQDDARKFLVDIGVREVGEVEQVKAILDQRYSEASFKPDFKDLEGFVAFVEKLPKQSEIFANYPIFMRANGKWGRPSQTYLDSPFQDTGLCAYYLTQSTGAKKAALADSYQHAPVDNERLRKFARSIGVQTSLAVQSTNCFQNPNWSHLQSGDVPKSSNDSYGRVDTDFDVYEFEALLARMDVASSRLIWTTMTNVLRSNQLVATYRRNNYSEERTSDSQLVHRLLNAAWVPQSDGRFVRPCEAARELLPKGFPYDEGYEWLKAVSFGEEEQKRSDEHEQTQTTAQRYGFPDWDSLERARKFAALPLSEQERILDEWQRKQRANLPEHEPRNPKQRAENVRKKAAKAPKRITEDRTRSVSVGREEIKQEAAPYLCEQYTNSDGEMICQICKAPLPFKLDDGSYYFEKVEFLEDLMRRHYQNYLALCPNHSAMFQHANGSRGRLQGTFKETVGNELPMVLAQLDVTVYFTKTHISDLREVLKTESEIDATGDDNSYADCSS